MGPGEKGACELGCGACEQGLKELDASIDLGKLIGTTVMLMAGPQVPPARDKEKDFFFFSKLELSPSSPPLPTPPPPPENGGPLSKC